MAGDHALFSPSSAYQWILCPGAPRLIASLRAQNRLPPDTDSDHSIRGTACHEMAEEALTGGLEPWEWIGRVYHGDVTVDADMAMATQAYVDAVDELDIEIHAVECRLKADEHVWGTADIVGTRGDDTLVVADAKFGYRDVDAKRNPQTRIYGVGWTTKWHGAPLPPRVEMHIIQPNGNGPLVKTETMTTRQLTEWYHDVVMPAVRAALLPDAPLIAGTEQCRWCPAAEICPELERIAQEGLSRMHTQNTPEPLDDEDMVERIQELEIIKTYDKALHKRLWRRVLGDGASIPGYKAVQKTKHRTYRLEAETAARAAFGAKAYEPRLKSPAQMEKEFGKAGKAFTAEWSYKPKGDLTVVKDTDTREAQNPAGNGGLIVDE